MSIIYQINNSLFTYIHGFSFHSAPLDTLIIFFAVSFPIVFCICILLFIIVHRDRDADPLTWYAIRRKLIEALIIALTGLSAWGIVTWLKIIFHQARPFITDPTLQTLFTIHGINDSFPSGHATVFAALAVAIYMYHKKIGGVFMVGAFLIGLARIAAGIHYPIDILAGYILGSIISFVIYQYLRPLGKRIFTKAILK